MSLLKKIQRFAGIDRAIGYSVLARAIGAVAQPVTLVMIASFMSAGEQGYFYAFAGILALGSLLDLGFTSVLQLHASHEKAHLDWSEQGCLAGDPEAENRLFSLLRLGIKWHVAKALLSLAVILPFGLFFLARHDLSADVNWRLPWIAAVCVMAGMSLLAPFLSGIEGCGHVKEMRFIELSQPLMAYPLMWLVLLAGGGLFAGPAFFGAGLVVVLFWLISKYRAFVLQVIGHVARQGTVRWRDVWPLQWRTAIGWISGYLILQLFCPLLFAVRGPVEAGQMGMSLALAQAAGGVGLYWITNKVPQMGVLWARRDFSELDRLFFPALWRAIGITVVGMLLLALGGWGLQVVSSPYAQRILPLLPFLLILAVQPFNNILFAFSAYLRANKKDPLVGVVLAYGCAVAVLNLLLGSRYGAAGMVYGYLAACIAAFLAGTVAFFRYKRMWQGRLVAPLN